MKYRISMMGLAFTLLVAFNAMAENAILIDGQHSRSQDFREPTWTAQLERHRRIASRTVKEAARAFIEQSVQEATHGRAVVTSRDRPQGPLSSPAHERGAIDIVIPNLRDLHSEAKNIARTLGRGHTTIVEEPRSDHDNHTLYRVMAGHHEIQVVRYRAPKRATAAHIHIQPDF